MTRVLPKRVRIPLLLGAIGLVCAALGVSLMISGVERGRAAPASDTGLKGRVKGERGLLRLDAAQWANLKVEPVALHSFQSAFSTEGKIAIDEDRATRLYSPYAGRISQLIVAPGEAVQKGQLVFVIEATDSVQAQSDFVAAIAGLNKAKSQVHLTQIVERRMASLYGDKAMPLKDWQEAEANLVAAQNDLRSAEIALQAVRNRLRLLGKTSEEIDTFEKTGVITPDAPVYSPIAGTILQRRVGPGQFIDAGASESEPIFRIGDVSKVWLVAYVRETDAAKVRLGQRTRFTVLTHPGRQFEGKIDYVASSFDPDSRRLLVRATIDNAEGLLRPEMFATVNVIVDESGPSPAVPRDAIVHDGTVARVWTVRNGDTVELRQIRPGIANGEMIQVLDGLALGEKVITRGSLFIDRASDLRG